MPTTADFNLSTGRMENLGGTDVPVNLVLNTDRSTKAEAHWEMLVIPHTKDDVQPGSRIFTFSFEGEERKFVWPDNIPFVKGTNATYNFRLTEDFMGITDSDGKTNCIMVKPGYTVMFPVVRAYEGDGASDKLRVDGENYDGEFEEEATVVWSDAEVIGGSKVEGKGKDARVIIDTYPNISGNAVVAIKRKDTGEIVWSYHIWVTKYRGQLTATQNGFTFMDRNLGADKPSLGTDNDVDRTHGLFYQWGRKDPFPSTGKPGDNQAVGKFTAKAASSTVGSIKYTIKHPDEFIYLLKNTTNADWLDNTLWGHDGGKSIYDPCPAGWRVPSMSGSNPWAGFTKDNNDVFSKGYDWGDNAIYPGTGYRRGSDNMGSVADISTEFIHVWSGSPDSNNNSTLFYGDRGGVDTISFGRTNGASVRCVKE
jgi:hypothetical protein